MKTLCITLLTVIYSYSQINDTLVIKNATFQDIGFNDQTNNFEIVFTTDDIFKYPYIVSIDSNNIIIDEPQKISSLGGAFGPVLDIRNGVIASAWGYVNMSWNNWILGSVMNDERELIYQSEIINFDSRDFIRGGPDISFINDSLFFVCWSQLNQADQEVSLRGKVLNIYEYGDYWQQQDKYLSDILYVSGGSIRVDIRDDHEYFPISWSVSLDSYNYGLYGRIFDKDITPISNVFPIGTDTVKYTNGELLMVDSTSFLNCFVKYTTMASDKGNIFLTKVGFDGVIESTIIVNDQLIENSFIDVSMSVNANGYIIIVWDSNDDIIIRRQIMGQRFDPGLSRIGDNFIIAPAESGKTSIGPKVVLINNRVVVSYTYSISGNEPSDLVVKMFDFDNPVSIEEKQSKSPIYFTLRQNYPNPFNLSTSIQYAVSRRQFVSLKVYDVLGNEVAVLANEYKTAGTYTVEFNANGFTSGVYFYQLRAGEFIETREMILLR